MNCSTLLSAINKYKSASIKDLNDDYLKDWKRWEPIWKSNPENNYTTDVNFLMKFFECHNDCEKSGECKARFRLLSWQQSKRRTMSADTSIGHHGVPSLLEKKAAESLQSMLFIEDVCPNLICFLGLVFNVDVGFWAEYLGGKELSQMELVDPWLRLPITQNTAYGGSWFHLSSIEAREVSSDNILDWKHDRMADPLQYGAHDSTPWRTRKITVLPERRRYDGSKMWRPVAFIHRRLSIWCSEGDAGRGRFA